MRILVVSDLHGDLSSVEEAIDAFAPEALLSCGDWGDPDQVDPRAMRRIVDLLPLATTFGNHDPMTILGELKNHDGTPVLLGQGEVRRFSGLTIAAIGGIWAKSHRQPYYVTDGDVAALTARIVEEAPSGVDVLLSHGCAIGLADLTESGRHGGQRFLEAFQANHHTRIYLCGHLHVSQDRTLRDGRRVLNVGATPEGSVVILENRDTGLSARSSGSSGRPTQPRMSLTSRVIRSTG
ncbi:MAG: metallophosphoesterase family protein [Isosphaeraceae bacterium]